MPPNFNRDYRKAQSLMIKTAGPTCALSQIAVRVWCVGFIKAPHS
jgi:hypothetical protein